MKNMWVLFVFYCLFVICDGQRTPEEWKTRIVYHILTDRFALDGGEDAEPCDDLSTYCGGTWQGVIDKLNYIQNLGANAIWISPIVQNVPNGYHGYWAKNIYEVNEQFGTEEDLQNLVTACHERDIWVMVDVVPNHMGYPHGCSWPEAPGEECDESQLQNYTGLTPFDQPEHYHQFCRIDDYTNQTQVEYCRLANLPDLNQTVDFVRDTLYEWIAELTVQYGFDGYRVDTVKHISLDFWADYQAAAENFLMGEVWDGDSSYVGPYQFEIDSLFNFPSLLTSNGVFHYGEPMTNLNRSIHEQRQEFRDVSVLGLLADNHDFPRFLHESNDVTLLKNAMTYVMLGEGIPFIYYGTEQGFNGGPDPECRESLWPYYNEEHEMFLFLRNLSDFRMDNMASLANGQKELYVDTNSLVFTRADDNILVLINKLGSSGGGIVIVDGLEDLEGVSYINYLDPSDSVTVTDGKLSISISFGQPKVYYTT